MAGKCHDRNAVHRVVCTCEVGGLSKLATYSDIKLKDVNDRTSPVWGVVVHTTGSTIVERAYEHGADPLEYAMAYYLRPDSYAAHYVVGHDGTIAQIADEHERMPHVGVTAADRQAYLSGAWVEMLPARLVELWRAYWLNTKSPAHLYPGPSVNNVTVGIEMLPLVPPPTDFPRRYTPEQHSAVGALCDDIARRWRFPKGWETTSRLMGHEDCAPLARHTRRPPAGWDPGALRDAPWFDWLSVKHAIRDARKLRNDWRASASTMRSNCPD